MNVNLHVERDELITSIERMLFLSKSTFRQYMALSGFDFDTSITSVSVAKICHSRIHIIF